RTGVTKARAMPTEIHRQTAIMLSIRPSLGFSRELFHRPLRKSRRRRSGLSLANHARPFGPSRLCRFAHPIVDDHAVRARIEPRVDACTSPAIGTIYAR